MLMTQTKIQITAIACREWQMAYIQQQDFDRVRLDMAELEKWMRLQKIAG